MINLSSPQTVSVVVASGFSITGIRHDFMSEPKNTRIDVSMLNEAGESVKNPSITLEGADHDDFWNNHYGTDTDIIAFVQTKLGLTTPPVSKEEASAVFTDPVETPEPALQE